MVNNLDLSTLISQIPEAQKLHLPQVAHPEAQQALAQELVLRRQRLEKKQVAKSEETAAETEVDPEGRPQAEHHHAFGKRQHPHHVSDEYEADHGRLIDTQV